MLAIKKEVSVVNLARNASAKSSKMWKLQLNGPTINKKSCKMGSIFYY